MDDMGMTDKQFDKIIKMISMILDGCKDLDEAKKKVNELSGNPKKKKKNKERERNLSPLFLL